MRIAFLASSLLALAAVNAVAADHHGAAHGRHQQQKKWVRGPSVINDGDGGFPPAGTNADMMHGSTVLMTTPDHKPTPPSLPPQAATQAAEALSKAFSGPDALRIIAAAEPSPSPSSSSAAAPAAQKWFLAPADPAPVALAAATEAETPAPAAATTTRAPRLTYKERKEAALAGQAVPEPGREKREKRWLWGTSILQDDPPATPTTTPPPTTTTSFAGPPPTPNLTSVLCQIYGCPSTLTEPAQISSYLSSAQAAALSSLQNGGVGFPGAHSTPDPTKGLHTPSFPGSPGSPPPGGWGFPDGGFPGQPGYETTTTTTTTTPAPTTTTTTTTTEAPPATTSASGVTLENSSSSSATGGANLDLTQVTGLLGNLLNSLGLGGILGRRDLSLTHVERALHERGLNLGEEVKRALAEQGAAEAEAKMRGRRTVDIPGGSKMVKRVVRRDLGKELGTAGGRAKARRAVDHE
ncbi:hypothetical protein JCM8097_005115 [Rhodosporidiobolus ruineniae]